MDTEGTNNPFHLFMEGKMIIEIDFLKIERKEVRKAVIVAFDLLGDSEKGGIFRPLVCRRQR